MQTKKIPVRMCSGCGQHFPKKELVRVVRSPQGEISVDLTGKIVVIEGWEFELTYADETVETRELVPINQHKYIIFNETSFTIEEEADGEPDANESGSENPDGGEQTPSGEDAD